MPRSADSRLLFSLILVQFLTVSPFVVGDPPPFRRGDANADRQLDLSDAVRTFAWLFQGDEEPACLDAVDANDDGKPDLSDGIYTLSYLFRDGRPLPPPEKCGPDPTAEDPLGCERFPACECGGFIGLLCREDEFCDLPPGSCGGADLTGTCVPVVDPCPENYFPVCGCDGKTYGNECEANAAGVSVRREGECPTTDGDEICGGIAGLPCKQGEFCQFETGTCGAADQSGLCRVLPEVCPAVVDPVCGCDGQTYDNECEAFQAGVSAQSEGECPTG